MVSQSDMSGVQKGLHGWLVGYYLECRKVFMVGQSDTVWSAERASWLASRICLECRKVFMVGQSDMSGVQKGLHGWLVGYVWSAERALWLASRICLECREGFMVGQSDMSGVQKSLCGRPIRFR